MLATSVHNCCKNGSSPSFDSAGENNPTRLGAKAKVYVLEHKSTLHLFPLKEIHAQDDRKWVLVKNLKFMVPRERKKTHMKLSGIRDLTLPPVRK
jgi:hypothetical protein